MGRRRRLVSKPSHTASTALDLSVSKRSRTGWTLTQAQHLLEQGYPLEHVTKTTGWTAKAVENNTKEKKR